MMSGSVGGSERDPFSDRDDSSSFVSGGASSSRRPSSSLASYSHTSYSRTTPSVGSAGHRSANRSRAGSNAQSMRSQPNYNNYRR